MNYITPGMTPTFSLAKVKLTDVKDRGGTRATRQKTSIKLSRGRIYRKIPKISPGAYIFQGPFLRGLFLEGLIFGEAYVRREICVSKSIRLACSWKEIYRFCFV